LPQCTANVRFGSSAAAPSRWGRGRYTSESGHGRLSSSRPLPRYAAECLRIAENIGDTQNKAALIVIAENWLHLANQAEKNLQTVLIYETPQLQPKKA
jgi:hypothetical protein